MDGEPVGELDELPAYFFDSMKHAGTQILGVCGVEHPRAELEKFLTFSRPHSMTTSYCTIPNWSHLNDHYFNYILCKKGNATKIYQRHYYQDYSLKSFTIELQLSSVI